MKLANESGHLLLVVCVLLPLCCRVDRGSCSTAIPLGNEVLRQPLGVPVPTNAARTHGETTASDQSTFEQRVEITPVSPPGTSALQSASLRQSLPVVVCVQPHQGTNYAVIALDKSPQFCIENHCGQALTCQEVDKSGDSAIGPSLCLQPHSTLHWQPPSATMTYPSLTVGDDRPSVYVRFQEESSQKSSILIDVSRPCVVNTSVGYVRVVRGPSACSSIIVSPELSDNPLGTKEGETVEEKVAVSFREFSVVLHQGSGLDLSASLGLCLRKVNISVSSLPHSATNFSLSVGYMQVENMHKGDDVEFPVILTRQVDPISERARQCLPSLLNNDSGTLYLGVELAGPNYMRKVALQVPKLIVNVEDALLTQLTALKQFAEIVVKSKEDLMPDSPLRQVSLTGLPQSLEKAMPSALHPLQIGEWSVSEVHIMLTAQVSAKIFLSIDRSPVRLEQFRTWPCVSSPVTLTETASLHYISGGLASLGWLVSSLELIGSPGGLLRSVGDGVRDFVQLPYQGLSQGPGSFLTGLGGGTSSLLRHLSAGVISSLSHFAESAARNLDTLSMDSEHASQQQQMRHRSQVGLRTGLHSFGMAWLGAVAGLASHPLQPFMATDKPADGESKEAASSGGMVTGGLKMVGSSIAGVGRGLVGAVTKPVSGAMDLIAHTGQGLLTSLDLVPCLEAHMVTPPLSRVPSVLQR